MQGLAGGERVIYVGSLSKALFPAMGLAYIVVPPDLADAFTSERIAGARHVGAVEEAVLADFVRKGHLAWHICRMRPRYWERQRTLVEAARREMGDMAHVEPADAGTHLVAYLPRGWDDCLVAQRAVARGIEVAPLSPHYMGASRRHGLLLGFAGFRPPAIQNAMRNLGLALLAR